jgi:uncharacterized membrane protein YeaQ/YmgE (transglycosylase-associated protein family)
VGILMTLIVGGVVGWLASLVMKTNAQMGILANIVVGIVGSVLGGWLSGLLQIRVGGDVGGLVMNVVGAMALIALLKALKVYR